MNKSMIFVGVGSFGLGALISGIITAKIVAKKKDDELTAALKRELQKERKFRSSIDSEKSAAVEEVGVGAAPISRPEKPSLASLREKARVDYGKYFGTNPGDPIGEDEYVDEEEEVFHEEASLSLEEREETEPYFIEEGVAGEEYDVETLSIFRDKIVTNDQNLPINADEILGVDNLKMFYASTQDQMYIRNDKLRIDYELLREVTNYAQVLSDRPHLVR